MSYLTAEVRRDLFMDNFDYNELMKEKLSEELYKHSAGVAEAAVSLAERFGADQGKAYLAGIVHDYGKRYPKSELRRKAEELNLKLDRITLLEPRLLHAPVGAALLPLELGIEDDEILQAVAFHTTGHSDMSLLDKVIYLADCIEDGRRYRGVDRIRELACEDLDRALLAAVERTIYSILQRGMLLHPQSVKLRNSLIEKLKSG
ncbi:MAG: bis(5'-nucleosyl)-tetraphosphatase (symmetrical) YqeK [Bacillota bacterium]